MSVTAEGFASHEGFQPADLETKLKAFGLELTPQQLSELNNGIVLDTLTYKMTPKESIYIRLSHLAPVVATARRMKATEIADIKKSEHSFISKTVDSATADIFNKIKQLDNDHRQAIRDAAAVMSNNVPADSSAMGIISPNSVIVDDISNLKPAMNSMSVDVTPTDVKSTTGVAVSNAITDTASSSETFTAPDNIKSSIDNKNDARKWSMDTLTNLQAIKDTISTIASQGRSF